MIRCINLINSLNFKKFDFNNKITIKYNFEEKK